MMKEPLKVESLVGGEATILTGLAGLEAEYLDKNRTDPYWVERIDRLKANLKTPFAKQIASYLLGEEECGEDALPAEKAAWNLANKMMLQVRPGFRAKLDREKLEAAMNAR